MSAISIAVMPSDQMSALISYPSWALDEMILRCTANKKHAHPTLQQARQQRARGAATSCDDGGGGQTNSGAIQ